MIPGLVQLTLDWRNVPAETPDDIVQKIEALLSTALNESPYAAEVQARVAISKKAFTTYTGLTEDFPSIFPSFLMPEQDPLVQTAQATLIEALGRDDGVGIWSFATDGGHLMQAGIPTLGFGPGDDKLPHTNQERISLAQIEEALIGYTALLLTLPTLEA